MTTIIELLIIFQRPIPEGEIDPAEVDLKAFATQGQAEVYKYIRTSKGTFAENHLEVLPVNIPTGISGMGNAVKIAVMRLMNNLVAKKEFNDLWELFYVIAKFDDGTGEPFFRTIMPRTEIPLSLRRVRRRNVRNRKPRPTTNRRVRRKKL